MRFPSFTAAHMQLVQFLEGLVFDRRPVHLHCAHACAVIAAAGGPELSGSHVMRGQLRMGEPLLHDLPRAAGVPEDFQAAARRFGHACRLRRLAQHCQGASLIASWRCHLRVTPHTRRTPVIATQSPA